MNASTWQTIGVVVAIASAIISAYYLAKSNIRDQTRQREAERAKAVDAARAPLITENSQLNGTIAQLRAELQRRDEQLRLEVQRREDRITTLEDQLYRGRGTTP